MKDDQGVWNFIFSVFFALLFGGAVWLLFSLGRLPLSIGVFDFILIILATFRLTRLFVYDKITQFIRDWFIHKTVVEGEHELVVVRQNVTSGPRRTIHDLLSCPWCMGVWLALVVSFFYYLTPFAWFPILVLAISGVATFFQLFANMVGWRAERLKQKVERDTV